MEWRRIGSYTSMVAVLDVVSIIFQIVPAVITLGVISAVMKLIQGLG
jgi:hypothetical protein